MTLDYVFKSFCTNVLPPRSGFKVVPEEQVGCPWWNVLIRGHNQTKGDFEITVHDTPLRKAEPRAGDAEPREPHSRWGRAKQTAGSPSSSGTLWKTAGRCLRKKNIRSWHPDTVFPVVYPKDLKTDVQPKPAHRYLQQPCPQLQ